MMIVRGGEEQALQDYIISSCPIQIYPPHPPVMPQNLLSFPIPVPPPVRACAQATLAFENQEEGFIAKLLVPQVWTMMVHVWRWWIALALSRRVQQAAGCPRGAAGQPVPSSPPITPNPLLTNLRALGFSRHPRPSPFPPQGTKDIPVGQPVAVLVEERGAIAAFANFVVGAASPPAAAPTPAKAAAPPAPKAASSYPPHTVSSSVCLAHFPQNLFSPSP